MDRPLESSRDRDHPYAGGSDGYHRGGGGGGRSFHRGGRGRGRGGGRGGYRGGGRGRGRGRGGGRHHQYGGGGGGGRSHHREWEDPNARLMKQLSVMVSRVGEFKPPPVTTSSDNDQIGGGDSNPLRPLVNAIAKNISDLTKVVSKTSNLPTFLKFIPPPPPPKEPSGENAIGMGFTRPPPKPEDQAGPMAHLIVSCAATLPLQTPCYAALTLSVHEYSLSHADYAGFANRCVTYTMQRLSYDMDTLFLSSTKSIAEQRPKIACRIKLLLRYLAILGRINIVQAQGGGGSHPQGGEQGDESASSLPSYSMLEFLQRLVEAALAAVPTDDAFAPTSSSNASAALVLVYFVLSTIPYLVSYIPADVIQETLLDPLQSVWGSYASTFTPGVGMTAILLKEEQVEGGDEDEEEEEEDDDEEEEASEVVCDSLQDLYRSVQLLLKEQQSSERPPSRFALLTDEPWKGISSPPQPAPAENSTTTGMDTADGQQQAIAEAEQAGPLLYTGTPLRLILPEGGFQALALLFKLNDNSSEVDDDGNAAGAQPKVQFFPLEVVVFGRLPIFGAPRTGSEDRGEDEEDMEEDDAPANEHVGAYSKDFGILDRCFLADTIRDLLCCHESSVSAIGQERGSAKSVAEQLWSVGQVLVAAAGHGHDGSSSSSPAGLEYGILEAMLSLILQSSSSSTFRQIFLSRVLLELTRLQPTYVSPALALATSNMFQDYIPALVPTARRNLSCWLAFHLVNTDYQWPAAYWAHWQTYTTEGKKAQSRGIFVKATLSFLMENVNNPGVVVRECLPADCQDLASQVVCPRVENLDQDSSTSVLDSLEKEVRRRIWDDDEHPDNLTAYITGDEVSETLAEVQNDGSFKLERMWCRSGNVFRSLLQPLEREHQRLLATVEQARQKIQENGDEDNENNNSMDEDDDFSEDTLAVLFEILSRYGPVLAASITKDKEIVKRRLEESGKDSGMLHSCEPYLLSILDTKACFSGSVMEGCLDNLLEQQEILDSMSVLRWALGDVSGGDGRDQQVVTSIATRWYEFASDAIRVHLAKKICETQGKESSNGEGGMVIDRTGDGDGIDIGGGNQDGASKTLAAIESLSPLLDYIVRRACTLLADQADEQKRGNKLTPEQVDLLEGVKSCLRSSHALLFSELRKSNENESGTEERVIKECLSQSTLAGWKLAGVCQEFSSSHAVNVLKESLAAL